MSGVPWHAIRKAVLGLRTGRPTSLLVFATVGSPAERVRPFCELLVRSAGAAAVATRRREWARATADFDWIAAADQPLDIVSELFAHGAVSAAALQLSSRCAAGGKLPDANLAGESNATRAAFVLSALSDHRSCDWWAYRRARMHPCTRAGGVYVSDDGAPPYAPSASMRAAAAQPGRSGITVRDFFLGSCEARPWHRWVWRAAARQHAAAATQALLTGPEQSGSTLAAERAHSVEEHAHAGASGSHAPTDASALTAWRAQPSCSVRFAPRSGQHADLCRQLAGRRLLFAGDSIQGQMAMSLLGLLGAVDGAAFVSVGGGAAAEPTPVCNGTAAIGYMRSDYLYDRCKAKQPHLCRLRWEAVDQVRAPYSYACSSLLELTMSSP